jgi:phage shock protein A
LAALFEFLKRKKKPAKEDKKPLDPVAAYNGFIESLERQAAEVRKSAATLLALRGELARDRERYQRRIGEADERLKVAETNGDARAERTLRRDREEAQELLEQSEKALASANEDAALLMEAAEDLARRGRELKAERQSALARFRVGAAVSRALARRVEEFDKLMALDAARDEVEKAHALADIYREEEGALPKGAEGEPEEK